MMEQLIENWALPLGLVFLGLLFVGAVLAVSWVIRHAEPKPPLIRDSTGARIGRWADRVRESFPGVTIAIWWMDNTVTAHALEPEEMRMSKAADGIASFSGREVASARWHADGQVRSVHLEKGEFIPDDWAT